MQSGPHQKFIMDFETDDTAHIPRRLKKFFTWIESRIRLSNKFQMAWEVKERRVTQSFIAGCN